METSARKLQSIYAAFLGLLTLCVGLCFLFELADIYMTEAVPRFSYEDVASRVRLLLIPLCTWAVAVVGGFLVARALPSRPHLRKADAKTVYGRLRRNLPTGEGEEFDALQKRIRTFERIRCGLWLGVFVLGVLAAVFCGLRIFRTADYIAADVNATVISLVKYLAPWLAAVFVAAVGMLVFEHFAYQKVLPALKRLLVLGERGTRAPLSALSRGRMRAERLISSKWTVFAARGALLAVAVVFIVLGALNGGANDVLGKAAMICTECIGLG